MQLVNSESGARLVLYGHTNERSNNFTLSEHLWFDNIASRNTAEFLKDVNCKDIGFAIGAVKRQWPAVVLTPEECKLRVGGMSLTELQRKLADYWGQSDAAVGARDQDDQDMVTILEREIFTPGGHEVLSHWVTREYTQWLRYFIAKNHTLGAVHAWYAAFLGIARRSEDSLAESVISIAQSHQPESPRWHGRMSKAFMESIHRIKFRMSFDVCIAGHDEVVDDLPSLPSNTMITTNEKGMQIIHNNIRNMLPRRIWDICANTVIPATWFCGPPCPLTGRQVVGTLGVKPISHAWVADEDLSFILTEANQYLWPIPLPKGVLLEDVRGQMISLGVRYAWLDVLCLRQCAWTTLATGSTIPRAPSTETAEKREQREQRRYAWLDVLFFRQRAQRPQPTLAVERPEQRREQRRLEEWKVDVPTIGAIYSNLDNDGLYGGGPIIIYMSGLGHPFREEGWDSERHWLRRAWTLQETPVPVKCIIIGVGGYSDRTRYCWPWTCEV